MYNRYIPQPDGSYQRRRYPDRPGPQRRPPTPPSRPPAEQPCEPEKPSPPPPEKEPCAPPPRHHRENCQSEGIGSFLRRLLPKNFDTTDLIIVLLLLLMAGDCPEDQNYALLTLVLYLFL